MHLSNPIQCDKHSYAIKIDSKQASTCRSNLDHHVTYHMLTSSEGRCTVSSPSDACSPQVQNRDRTGLVKYFASQVIQQRCLLCTDRGLCLHTLQHCFFVSFPGNDLPGTIAITIGVATVLMAISLSTKLHNITPPLGFGDGEPSSSHTINGILYSEFSV